METGRGFDSNLPANHQDMGGYDDPRVELYNQYANQVFEDFESFVDRMHCKYGERWVNILSRPGLL